MKKLLFLILTAFFILSLCACGGDSKDVSDAADSQGEAQVVVTELDSESVITHDGDYELSGMYTDILSDRAKAEGWYYYYSEGTESGVPQLKWEPAEGMYTGCKLFVTLKNLNENMTETFMSRYQGFIAYQVDLKGIPACATATEYLNAVKTAAAATENAEIFEYTLYQRNPGQLDSDGNPALSDTAVLLKAGEEATQDMFASISEEFLRSWEDADSTEPMWAVFTFDESTVYLVDLRVFLTDGVE